MEMEGKHLPRALRVRKKKLSELENCKLSFECVKRALVAFKQPSSESAVADMSDGKVTNMSTKQNVEDVGGSDPQLVDEGKSYSPEDGQTNAISLAQFMARPVRIDNRTLALSTDLLIKLRVWDLYSKDPSVRAKLRNFAYFRANLKLRINVSGSPFHYGRLLFSYQPYPDSNANLFYLEAERALTPAMSRCLNNYLSQARGSVVVDVKENQPLELDIPFICQNPMYKLFDATGSIAAASSYAELEEAGILYISTLNTIESTSATPSTVNMTIYAWCDDVKLGTITASRTEITTESGKAATKDERETGPIEKFSSTALAVSNALQAIPEIAPFARASSVVFGAAKSISAHFGWSKPLQESGDVAFMKNMAFRNGCHGLGVDSGYSMSLDPKCELLVDPRFAGVKEDEMSIPWIAGKETYLTTFTWDPTDVTSGGAIFSMMICPSLSTFVDDLVKTVIQPTAMAFATSPFYYWRGDVRIRLEAVCSNFHRGKVYVAYEPNASAFSTISSSVAINKQFSFLWDIQETQSVEFCVKWASNVPWLVTDPGSLMYTTTASAKTMASDSDNHNGYVNVIPFTSLQSPDSSAIPMNVYVSMENLHVNFHTNQNLLTSRAVAESGKADIQPNNRSLANREVTCIVLNDSNADEKFISDNYFGEEPTSFRTVLKRFTTPRTFSVAASATGLPSQIKYLQNTDTPFELQYGDVAVTTRSMFSYLRYAYLGYRGSQRHRIYIPGIAHNSCTSQVRVRTVSISNTLAITSGVTVAAFSATDASRPPQGALSFVPNSNGGIEFQVPYYTNMLFDISFADDSMSLPSTQHPKNSSFVVVYDTLDHAATTLLADCAAGEDFMFLRFCGSPFYSVAL